MDPVKRRLVYVADENEVLLSELSGTPPTRQSRHTQLLVPLSPPTSSQQSPHSVSPPPRPVDATAEAAPVATADKALLVSYDGFLLTDGSGRFSTPRDAAQAADIRDALKTCRSFLKGFLNAARPESESTESCSSGASSSTYMEEEDSDLEETSSDDSPVSRPRATKAARARPPHSHIHNPTQMTVAELKELLRNRGLSIAGNKACLVKRVQKLRAHESERALETGPLRLGAGQRTLQGSLRHETKLNSGVSVLSPPLSPLPSQRKSPNCHTSDEKNNSIWGALVHAGSRLFRGGARASWGFHTRPPEDADDAPLSTRRRISA
ncbi:SAP domain containing protein [Leishmania donovani]|uniref:SAP_domain_containing_protein_-_putative n=3 Tax=Leishmania donovani species complex TaxID=38574 RepID=A0A6L0Y1L7_LEIIN|nr:conserved hypothetical protein [Leishmania infantum JPCM5]TPP42434.1 SAP domain family protein [Leishmania donovani]CAC9548410.1 SAP_domain_containing_protein_-_putative [Leishmania infantum]CAJ1993363.1 SAP domain containing protein [Leishmania donovani]CAM72710.1 conserved hypothetical protein [Leishmania infantum JPCM5]SUZ46375.1 SAP_domain_containing_protein_-_putative [Leishmania infantum]|eukprot:XP_001469600.1 conserved hypothetical protein [Leishmania infantum JPCM5]